jgi:hypothetical protein
LFHSKTHTDVPNMKLDECRGIRPWMMMHVGQLSVDFVVVHGFRIRFLFGI